MMTQNSNPVFLMSAMTALLFVLTGCGDEVPTTSIEEAQSYSSNTSVDADGKFDRSSSNDELSRDRGNPSSDTCDLPAQTNDLTALQLGDRQQGFEGWYLRFQPRGSKQSYAVIVAYWRPEKDGRLRGFVEVIDSKAKAPYKFESNDVGLVKPGEPLSVKIGGVQLTDTSLRGSFETDRGEMVKLDVDFLGCRHWGNPDDAGDRSTMGLPARVPMIPLKWHVSHLDGSVDGRLTLGVKNVTLQNARIHMEKNWGKAFPKKWIWLQANDFGPGVDVAFVGAGGPIMDWSVSPNGYMAGLRVGHEFFKWRTQDLSGFRIAEVDWTNDRLRWKLSARNGIALLEVEGTGRISDLIPVDVPTSEGLKIGAGEILNGQLVIRLKRRNKRYQRAVRYHDEEVFQSSTAALELGGTFLEQLRSDGRVDWTDN